MVRNAIYDLTRNSCEEWEICCEVTDSQAVMEKAAELKPDLVIVDLIMSKRNSLSAGREIRALFPEIPIILFTMVASSSLRMLLL